MTRAPLSWLGIVRLGLVQTALGAIVVLTTSTINRVMVVELALPAMLPGALVGFHYALQVLRPRWGFGSDVAGRRTPWIVFGMGVLALGGVGAAMATALFPYSMVQGLLLAVVAFLFIGIGVGAAGTSLLALLAVRVSAQRRAAAATVVWLMMILGFIVTTVIVGKLLDPYSPARLVAITSAVSLIAFVAALFALWGVEGAGETRVESEDEEGQPAFRDALRQVWDEPEARRFTIFVFISMLAYSMQDLILEPFAGIVFGLTPGQSTQLSGLQHSGVFAGMIIVALACSTRLGFGTLRGWVIGGCLASAAALMSLAFIGMIGPVGPLRACVFVLGIANGAFAVAAIGNMMGLAAQTGTSRVGVRMGLWGAAQAVAFGVGGFAGAVLVDLMRLFVASPGDAYTIVFATEALLFVAAAALAHRSIKPQARPATNSAQPIQARLSVNPS